MVELKIDTHGFEKKLEENARKFPFRMFKAYKTAARKAQGWAAKLISGPVLKVRTNRLRSGLSPFFQKKGKDRVLVGIGVLAFYGVYHEKGKGINYRPFLKPSMQKAWDWLVKEVEVWDD